VVTGSGLLSQSAAAVRKVFLQRPESRTQFRK
jgi:hypothetical protein